MQLFSFSYKAPEWELDELTPIKLTSLIVGKNAAGKTRTLQSIQNVASFVLSKPFPFPSKTFKTKLVFSDNGDDSWRMTYAFEIEEGKVKSEHLMVHGSSIIQRTTTTARIRKEQINPPADKLVIQVRRDRELFPNIEMLMQLFEGLVFVACSNINPYTNVVPAGFINPIPFSDLVNSLSKEAKKCVLDDAGSLGYYISDISTFVFNNELKFVSVKERYVKQDILDFQLSNGMIRVLYILCLMRYVQSPDNRCTLLLIDDIGEGLDYSRSIHLGNLVFSTCENNGLQLITTSNDAFVMDVVDVSKWQIIRRNKRKISVINKSNKPDLFKKFSMTGLSNFDLFSSDFIDNYLHNNAR